MTPKLDYWMHIGVIVVRSIQCTYLEFIRTGRIHGLVEVSSSIFQLGEVKEGKILLKCCNLETYSLCTTGWWKDSDTLSSYNWTRKGIQYHSNVMLHLVAYVRSLQVLKNLLLKEVWQLSHLRMFILLFVGLTIANKMSTEIILRNYRKSFRN